MVNEVLAYLRCHNLAGKTEANASAERVETDESTSSWKRVPETVEPNPDAVFIDGTLGTAGHTLAMLQAHPTCRVIAFDRDEVSMSFARQRLSDAGVLERVTFVQGDFRNAGELLQPYLEKQKVGADGRPIEHIDGALVDAGMSLWQVTNPLHGLSFRTDSPLDMRYNRQQDWSAYDLVNHLSTSDLEDLLFKYADERWARRIALTIEAQRQRNPIHTTAELASLVEAAIPSGVRRQSRVHPATKTFAALRLAVNDEFWALDQGSWALSSVLAITARLVFLTYSSNEDRIIKRTFRRLAGLEGDPSTLDAAKARKKRKTDASSGKRRPSGHARSSLTFSLEMPGEDAERDSQILQSCQGWGQTWQMKIVTKKPVEPTPEEIASNPLSRSCKLRAVEKYAL
jgi:16S rRNA (cytosine1402-N4)-methyltransferase